MGFSGSEMPQNIEIKARARCWDRQWGIAAAMADSTEELVQEDTFFACPGGRLKPRVLEGGEAELIAYQREDAPGPKTSNYKTATVTDPTALRSVLRCSLGEMGVLRKRRTVFLVGQTRIRFDEVENLGQFLEIEVTLREGQSRSEGHGAAEHLMAKLGIEADDLVEGAYLDILANRRLV